MFKKIKSFALFGLGGEVVDTEVALHRGQTSFKIVGLPDSAINEAKERVRSAIKHSGLKFPNNHLAINLAPADVRKTGSRFDLPIAIAILQANKQIELPDDIEEKMFIGELGFSGEVRPISGVLPIVAEAVKLGFSEIFVPEDNKHEASFIPGIKVYGVKTLSQLCDHFSHIQSIEPTPFAEFTAADLVLESPFDMQHVKGNEHAKRALEISASGQHNILMSGPPGSGKTMLARSLATILPKLSVNEALEVTKVHSIAQLTDANNPLIKERPFRSVHHTASGVSIVGGGNPPKPGEISLAHRGVLFLDELPEFPQKTLEVMRQPLENGHITISRASGSCVFPARFMLVAAMNPTPCGYPVDDPKCTSTPFEIQRYQNKISGPLLDRIDLHIQVPRIPVEKITGLPAGESSATVRQRVEQARAIQSHRLKDEPILANSEMSSAMVKKYCVLEPDAETLLKTAVTQMDLSGRAYFRILKVARTIADLAESENISMEHIAEAIQYRERREE